MVPLCLSTSTSADDLPRDHTRTVQSNGTHHGFLRRVGTGCHAAIPEGNPQRNQEARPQTTRLVENTKEGLEEVLLVLAEQILQCQHTQEKRHSRGWGKAKARNFRCNAVQGGEGARRRSGSATRSRKPAGPALLHYTSNPYFLPSCMHETEPNASPTSTAPI